MLKKVNGDREIARNI